MVKETTAPEVGDGSRNRYPPPKERNRNTLPASPLQSVRGLERKYRETLGELKALQEAEYEWVGRDGFALAEQYYYQRLESLRGTLTTIEKAIRMFDSKWERKRQMAPTLLKSTSPLLRKGRLGKALIRILKEEAQPLLVMDLAGRLAATLHLPFGSLAQRQRVWGMTYSALRQFYNAGYVVSIGKPAKWSAVASLPNGSLSVH